MTARPTIKSRIILALQDRSMRVSDLTMRLGSLQPQVARECRELAAQGRLLRQPDDGHHAVYGPATVGTSTARPFYKDEAREVEETYVRARLAGEDPISLIERLRLTPTAAVQFEQAFRYQTVDKPSRDSSCPAFANDERHLERVSPGFPALSERLVQGGGRVVSLPVIWPSEARA